MGPLVVARLALDERLEVAVFDESVVEVLDDAETREAKLSAESRRPVR